MVSAYLVTGRKEVLRKMLWQLADFSGVEILTYCVMSNHFHILVRVPDDSSVSDRELLRRYRLLYPKPTKYETATLREVERTLREGGEKAASLRARLLARMGDVSQFIKSLKQRFTIWYNQTHKRFGTLWAERFKSVLVEGKGNPLQTMAAYIDLNPVRAGLVRDPKDYRFCGYAEAVAGRPAARSGLSAVWNSSADGTPRRTSSVDEALADHRMFMLGQRAGEPGLIEIEREKILRELERSAGKLPRATVLRCRIRYFTDGAILGSAEYVAEMAALWQAGQGWKKAPVPRTLEGADWGDLSVAKGLRRSVFS